MACGSKGKNGLLHLYSTKNDYYSQRGVLKTKSQFHSVLEIKSAFTVYSTQNHSFRVCCIRISQERNKPQLTTMNLSANNSPTPLPDLFGLWVTSNQLSHSLNHRKRVYIYRS